VVGTMLLAVRQSCETSINRSYYEDWVFPADNPSSVCCLMARRHDLQGTKVNAATTLLLDVNILWGCSYSFVLRHKGLCRTTLSGFAAC
jgi:hypothetical protein